jgi:long-chain acyl-CoA synthetase
MLSQYNICFNITHILRRVKVNKEDCALSVAPLHHTYEMTAGCLCMLYSGASIAYNSSLRRLQAEMKIFRPTIMAAVPLILETFRNAVIKKYSRLKGGKAILSLQRVASDVVGNQRAGKKIFSIVNETFGGRMRLLVCGAALLSPEVFRDFERFGIRVLIGYGLTETSPVCLMHSDFYAAPDDIGYPLSGVQVRLMDVNEEGVGEIAVKGPNVMLGYYKNPEATANVMDNGWFRTGDLARITAKGTYQIAGRAKSMIVSPGGKKIFPEELELFLSKSEYVKEALVYSYGDEHDRKITAAMVPDEEAVAARLEKDGYLVGTNEYAEAERKLFEGVVERVNASFPPYKRMSRTVIRHREFVKTTTRKIKRNEPDNLNEEG